MPVAPRTLEVTGRRRSGLSVTVVEIPAADDGSGPPSGGSSSRRRSTLSESFSDSASQIFGYSPNKRLSVSGNGLSLPVEMLEVSNPYLQQPRTSLDNSSVRRLSAQDLELIRRESSASDRQQTASNAMNRKYSERDAYLDVASNASGLGPRSQSLASVTSSRKSSPRTGRRNHGTSPGIGRRRRSSFSSNEALDVVDGIEQSDCLIVPPTDIEGKEYSPNSMRKSQSFTQALTNLITGGNDEEVKELEDEIHYLMDDQDVGKYRRFYHDGELIIWDPETGLGDMMAPNTMKLPRLRTLLNMLTDWLNDTLSSRRILVQSIFQDLYDGQVLEELMEVLTDTHNARTDSFCIAERLKKKRLARVLDWIDEVLGRTSLGPTEDSWNLERIWQQDFISTIHLLVALCRFFAKDTVHLPENVVIEVHRNEIKADSLQLVHKKWREHLTGVAGMSFSTSPLTPETMDVFDKFFIEAPHKIVEAEAVLVKFANQHLSKLSTHETITDFHDGFRSGTNIVMLLAVLGGYCIRLHELRLPVTSDRDRAHNVLLALRLMRESGIDHQGVDHPEDVVYGDSKATMRILYPIFKQYKYAV